MVFKKEKKSYHYLSFMQSPFFHFPFFFVQKFGFSMSPTYSMQNISYSHIVLSLHTVDVMSEIPFIVAPHTQLER